PFEWDVKRLAASFEVAGRDRGFDGKTRASINAAVSRSYREAIREFASMRNIDVWYARTDVEETARELQREVSVEERRRVGKNLARTGTKDSRRALAKLRELVDGEPRIASAPPLIVPLAELVPTGEQRQTREAFQTLIRSYRRTLPDDR